MSFLDLFKREKKTEDTLEEKTTKKIAKDRHSARVANLRDELEQLSNALVETELSTAVTRSEKEKQSDKMIRRMALIRYEIDIREGLLKWLC